MIVGTHTLQHPPSWDSQSTWKAESIPNKRVIRMIDKKCCGSPYFSSLTGEDWRDE